MENNAVHEMLRDYPDLLTQKHLAEIFGNNLQTIRELQRKGKLPFKNVSLTAKD